MGGPWWINKPMDLDAYAGAVRSMVEKWALREDKNAGAGLGALGQTTSIQ